MFSIKARPANRGRNHNGFDTERRQTMSSISTLLPGNLHDVFGENDPARRRAAIDEIFTEDCVFYDPSGAVHRGRYRGVRCGGH